MSSIPLKHRERRTRPQKIKVLHVRPVVLQQQTHIEIVSAQFAFRVRVVTIEIGFIVNGPRRAFAHADLQRLAQLLDIEEEEVRSVERVLAGHGEVGELLVVRHAARVAERIVAVDQAKWIAVDEGEDGDDQLGGRERQKRLGKNGFKIGS